MTMSVLTVDKGEEHQRKRKHAIIIQQSQYEQSLKNKCNKLLLFENHVQSDLPTEGDIICIKTIP